MTDSAPLAVIESREHLVSLLAEAAEIEHNLMCCYLYAAFSLKEGTDEGLTERELAAVRGWRRQIISVAVDEMAHLALVSNLTSAVGGVPHFGRPNFPVPIGAHPAGIVVKLAPFNWDTLEHFIYLERPEDSVVHEGKGFEPPRLYTRTAIPGRLMPTIHDYATVGAFYRAIRDGITRLAARDGEAALFIGNPEHQIGPDVANLPGLTRVRCLRTAGEALDGIVVQGEGAPGHSEGSHYARFLDIEKQFTELRAARPEFVPARPAAHNPVMRKPPIPDDRVYVELHPAAELLDLANAAYTHMLRLLEQAYAEVRGPSAQRAFVDAAIDTMFVISPVASALTRLPASDAHPGCTAGITFSTIRSGTQLPSGPSADRILIERSRELTLGATRLSELPANVAADLERIGKSLERSLALVATEPVKSPTKGPTLPLVPAAPQASSTITGDVESAEGKGLTLLFLAKRCIHSRHCVLGLPGVFKANVKGPWLDPDAATVEELVHVAHDCPSGAVQYRRKDDGPDESPPHVNLLQLRENGPLGFRAELLIDDAPAGYRATLCRCGASQNKPFCDGSHVTVGFTATGEPATKPSEPLLTRDGPLRIRPQKNGPLAVSGNLELCAGTGRTIDRSTEVRLCRCGGSANKPYCDGTHARIGFRSE